MLKNIVLANERWFIGTQCRHVKVIPEKVDVTNRGIVKTFAQRFCIGFKWVTPSNVVKSKLLDGWWRQNCVISLT